MPRGEIILLLSTVLAVLSASAQTIQISKENRTVAVTSTDEAEAPADLAAVSIGFDVFGADQTQTYADATRISNAVMDALHASGVAATAIESREQNLNPVGEEDKLRFAKGIRFHFSQSWQVTVPAGSAAAVLHTGVLAGANRSGDIQWKLRNEGELEAAASAKALEHARQTAERMVKGLGSRLGPLVYASNQAPSRGPFPGMIQAQTAMRAMAKDNLKPLALSPEKLSRSATVYAVFAIE